MNIFLESSYQSILRKVVEERKNSDSKFNFQAIAEATRIPKSYLSKVTTGKAHFSGDQLYSVCAFLGFSEMQMHYTSLLLELERSTLKARKQLIQRDLTAIKDQALDSREHIKARSGNLSDQELSEYYMDPMNQIVHICLSIPRYQSDPLKLSIDLGIPMTEMRTIIDKLEAFGVIERKNREIRTVVKSIHLPRTSSVFRSWRTQQKLLCTERLNRFPQSDDYSFSVTFSASEKVRDKIRVDFLELLKRSEGLVQESKQEDVYQMNFDLFSWNKKRA